MARPRARLHDAGIAHRRLDLDRSVARDDGTLGFGDLSSARVAETAADRRRDEAQALALTWSSSARSGRLAVARRARGDDGVLAVLPYLQAAALPPLVRDALDDADVDLDDVRNRVRADLGADEQQLVKLRRVTAGSLAQPRRCSASPPYTLIAAVRRTSTSSRLRRRAARRQLVVARASRSLLAQLPRVPAAVSTMGSIERPLPLGPLTALQFAICYVNLAIPSTAARVAINVRFFQRFGVTPATAMTAGRDRLGLRLRRPDRSSSSLCSSASDVDLGLSTDASDTSGAARSPSSSSA